jgi:hypothetical protein
LDAHLQEYLARCRAQLARLREELAPLESGKRQTYEIGSRGERRDTTQHWIEHIRRDIEIYEGVIRALENENRG